MKAPNAAVSGEKQEHTADERSELVNNALRLEESKA